MRFPIPVGERALGVSRSDGLTTNPGADCAKEASMGVLALDAPETVRMSKATPSFIVSITTLGNGYLGSRIDEERSEMRYLV